MINSLRKIACTEPVCRVPGQRLRLAILGATGSIGRQTIDIAAAHPELFSVVAITTNTRVEQAVEACRRVRPQFLAVSDAAHADRARQLLDGSGVTVLAGAEALCAVATHRDVDMVVTATVGYSGLLPTIHAIQAGKDIALANKETLVVAGDLIRRCLESSPSRIFPVDSEHSAIAQCLRGEASDSVRRLIITASGGPFRTWSAEAMATASPADALRHPNWSMGAKITIDSATMMNKAFEIIEAHYLFGIPADRIQAVIHPQSVVHSMVEFNDGAIKAQLGTPDMHLPIAYALGVNNRIDGAAQQLSFDDFMSLTFERPDVGKFPCLDYARQVLTRGGNTACVINAANEVAVDAFLGGHIRFDDFGKVIDYALQNVAFIDSPDLDALVHTNNLARATAQQQVSAIQRNIINQ